MSDCCESICFEISVIGLRSCVRSLCQTWETWQKVAIICTGCELTSFGVFQPHFSVALQCRLNFWSSCMCGPCVVYFSGRGHDFSLHLLVFIFFFAFSPSIPIWKKKKPTIFKEQFLPPHTVHTWRCWGEILLASFHIHRLHLMLSWTSVLFFLCFHLSCSFGRNTNVLALGKGWRWSCFLLGRMIRLWYTEVSGHL